MSACLRAYELRRAIELETKDWVVVDLWRGFVNAWLECEGHPEDLTRNSADIRKLAQQIVDRFGQFPNITVEDTELQIGFIISGKENSCPGPSKKSVHKAADPITPHNGQFSYATEDCRLAGAGIDFVFTRTYKNQGYFIGPIGANWNHAYNHALRIAGPTIFRSTGDLRVDAYQRHPKFGQSGFNYWMPPDGQDGVIVEHGASFVWRAPHGVRHFFEQDTNPFLHRLARIEDRNGNYLALYYDQQRLARVRVNHPDRFVTFHYDESDRLVAVRDFTGRQWSYGFDDFGDLVSATTPATDEYPNGLTTCYQVPVHPNMAVSSLTTCSGSSILRGAFFSKTSTAPGPALSNSTGSCGSGRAEGSTRSCTRTSISPSMSPTAMRSARRIGPDGPSATVR